MMDAVVSQALPNAMFEVEVEGGHKLIAYAAGRMRRYFIRITPGDRIRVARRQEDRGTGEFLGLIHAFDPPKRSAARRMKSGSVARNSSFNGVSIQPGAIALT